MDIMKILWVLAVIIIGEGLIFLYRGDLLDLKMFITLLIVEMIVAFLVWKIKQNEKTKNEKLSHSKKLVDNELKLRTDTYVGFYDNDSLKLCIKRLKPSDQTYEDYSKEIDAHLEDEYYEVWNHKKECDSFISKHNDLAKRLLDTTKEEILKEINKRNLSLTEWDERGKSPINYFIPKYLFLDVAYVIQSSYERLYDIDQHCVIGPSDNSLKPNTNRDILNDTIVAQYPEHFKWKLTINRYFAEGDINDIEKLKQIIKGTLNNALRKDDFIELRIYKKNAEEEHGLFLNGIIEIIKSVENDIPLKGKCKICGNL